MCRVAAREAVIAPTREAARRAPAKDDWVSAARGPAAIPALPPHHRGGAGCHGEYCPAGAAKDRKRCCRSARARAAQAKPRWRPTGSRDRSGQWFEAFRGFKFRGSKRRIGLATLRTVAGAPVNTPNTAGKGRLSAQPLLWSAHARDEIVVPERGSLLGRPKLLSRKTGGARRNA